MADDLTADSICGELADWVDGNWDPELSLVEWRTRLPREPSADHGVPFSLARRA
jgi:hypothetical protein